MNHMYTVRQIERHYKRASLLGQLKVYLFHFKVLLSIKRVKQNFALIPHWVIKISN